MTGHKVVISGISGRFPNADNFVEFQNNLLNGIDCTTVEHNRWTQDSTDIPKRIGKVNEITKFDRVFFGIHTKLTFIMDPSLKLMLEIVFEAIMDAGVNPRSLKGHNVSVYTATNFSESEKLIFHRKVQADGFGIVGASKAMIPNRISFFLGLHGPSSNMDSACAGGAAALERAYMDIKNGRAESAIVGSSMLNLHPHLSYQLRKLGFLSPDGYTRCFDDSADGCTRSDGVAVFFLQRESDAKRIYQEVVNVRSLHLNSSSTEQGILTTKAEPQAELIKTILKESNLTPDDICFVEATGAANKYADEQELKAIDEVFRNRKKPLQIGCVKSNIGNSVATNVQNAVFKVIVASETETIPPNLHFEKPNSNALGLLEGRLKVVTDVVPFEGPYSLVNVTSIAGSAGCIVLKAPNKQKKNDGIPEDDIPRLAIASGRTEEAVEYILEYLEGRPVDVELMQLMYSVFQSEISGHLYRGFTVLPAKGLPNVEQNKKEVLFKSGENREVWWIFSGMGSQWPGMGEALLRLPVFAAAIKKCDAVLKPLGYDIYKILTDKDKSAFDAIINSFVGIAAVQIGLVDVLKSVGLEPDFIIGHSVGELGCAYADGCFTAEQMIMAALSRGLASTETKLDRGSMAAVGLGYEQVKPLCPPDIDVACHNGPESSTISGPADSMKKFVADLTAKGIFAREVACSNIAYHSRYIAPAGPKLLERLQKVIPNPVPRSSKWVSSSVPQEEWNSVKARLCSAEYHTNNLLSAVLFEETSRLIPANAICIEIAPHGLLQAIVKRSLPSSCINVALTRRGHPDNLEVLLNALGKMYNNGLQPQVENLYPKVSLPVSVGTPSISSLVQWDHAVDWHNISHFDESSAKKGTVAHEIDLNDETYKHLLQNTVDGKISVPLSICLTLVLDIAKSFYGNSDGDYVFEDIKIPEKVITLPDNNILQLSTMISTASGKFEVLEELSSRILISGIIKETQAVDQDRLNVTLKQNTGAYDINQSDFYTELEMRSFQYSGELKNVLKSTIDGNHGLIRWDNDWMKLIESALQLYVFGDDSRQIEVPILIRKIVLDAKKHELQGKKSEEVPAYVDRELNYVSAGGLEIQGLQIAVISKKLEHSKLANDVATTQLLHDKTNISLVNALRIILQLVIENTFASKLQQINLIEQTNSDKVNAVNDIMKDIPESSYFKVSAVSYKDASFNKILNVILDDIKNYDVKTLSKQLNSNKFLLVFIPTAQENSYISSIESAGLKVVLARRLENETVLLLRKKQAFANVHVLNASSNIKDTIGKIKTLKVTDSDRIIVLIKSNDKVNLSDSLEQIENSADLRSIRIFNIQVPNVSDNDEILKKQLELDLLINILTPEKVWATLRQLKNSLNPRNSDISTVSLRYAHDPTSVAWVDGPLLENKQNIVKVEYSSLNSQDVLITKGSFYSYPSEMIGKNRLAPMTVGLEFSGTDAKGNKVMGVTCGNSVSTFVSADEELTWPVPKSWTLEDAATVPLSYVLAYSALIAKAQVKPGDKVMIVNCCSGVGLAVLHLATKQKCDIFATYETETEKKLLKSIWPNFTEKRLYKMSKDLVRDQVLLQTNGEGVDVIICNEIEVQEVDSWFAVCKRDTRLVLISNLNENESYESIGMEVFLKEVNFFTVIPKKILLPDAEAKNEIKNLVKEGISNGTVTPLVRTVYRRELLNDAFNACSAKKHIGKILIKVQPEGSAKSGALALPRLQCSQKKSYVLIEGLSNFGLELADWLITRGARNIVIASSAKYESGFKKLRYQLWKSYGVQIVERPGIDLSQPQNIKSLFKDASSIGPVDAVFDLRRTDTASKSNSASLNATTKILDEESRSSSPQLRFFVVFSAVTNKGTLLTLKKLGVVDRTSNIQDQTAVDIVEKRKKDGLSGVVVRCGLVDSAREVVLPPVTKYIQKLDEILGTAESVVEVSYVSPVSTEVEKDEMEDGAHLMDPIKKEAEEFKAMLLSDTSAIDNAIMNRA